MPNPVRTLIAKVLIEGTDDESWPQSDEHVRREYQRSLILSQNQPSAHLNIPDVRWGGECRIETELKARLASDLEIVIEGETKLYEGTSESTQDLEDTKSVSLTVPALTPNHLEPSTKMVQLRNTETFGGDHAEIYISCYNVGN